MKSLKSITVRAGTLLAETAFFFMAILRPVFAQTDLTLGGGADAAKPDDAATDLFGSKGIFKTITNILIFIIGAVAVIMLIIGGLRYVVSSGNDQAVASAKNTILYAIIGIVIAFLAYAAVNFVISQLNDNTVFLGPTLG